MSKAIRRAHRTERRKLRAAVRDRTRTTRATAKIRRAGVGTLATHCIAAGLTPRAAQSVAGTLRKNAPKANVAGTPGISYRKGRARQCTRYTRAEVAAIAAHYRPRKVEYKTTAARLTQASMAVAA